MTSSAAGSNENLPIVSIVVPSYNHENYIEETIQSALNQTYENIELIVVDDCSKDGSADVLEKLSRLHGFRFVRNGTNLGLNATLELGLSLASGRYVSVLSSDDLMMPNKIAEQVAYLLRTEDDAVYGTCYTLSEDGTRALVNLTDLERGFKDGSALQRIYADSSDAPLLQSALIRRECLLALWEERRRFKSDDWVTLIRLLEQYQIGFVNKPQFVYRQHPNNTYRNYWGTMPMRVEVISLVTPEPLRPFALANLFRDQALFLYMDGKTGPALKFLIASMVLNPRPGNWMRLISGLTVRVIRQGVRKLLS
jgi:glycosyltransferase involved in cell wall biosynthesis